MQLLVVFAYPFPVFHCEFRGAYIFGEKVSLNIWEDMQNLSFLNNHVFTVQSMHTSNFDANFSFLNSPLILGGEVKNIVS